MREIQATFAKRSSARPRATGTAALRHVRSALKRSSERITAPDRAHRSPGDAAPWGTTFGSNASMTKIRTVRTLASSVSCCTRKSDAQLQFPNLNITSERPMLRLLRNVTS